MAKGWCPSEAARRWHEMENYLKCRRRSVPEPWPPERINELVAICRLFADENHKLTLLVSQMLLPWRLVRRDMSRIARVLGSGWSDFTTADLDNLEAVMRRRYANEPVDDPDPDGI